MTNAEAIETLRANYPDACFEQLREAVDAAIEALKVADMLEKLPSAQQEQNGYWRNYEGYLLCSECGEYYDDTMEYCGDDVPHICLNCGAKMDRERKDDEHTD